MVRAPASSLEHSSVRSLRRQFPSTPVSSNVLLDTDGEHVGAHGWHHDSIAHGRLSSAATRLGVWRSRREHLPDAVTFYPFASTGIRVRVPGLFIDALAPAPVGRDATAHPCSGRRAHRSPARIGSRNLELLPLHDVEKPDKFIRGKFDRTDDRVLVLRLALHHDDCGTFYGTVFDRSRHQPCGYVRVTVGG